MAAAEEFQMSLKVMMIKESNKVLYAEVDSDFADVLLSFLTLPLGTIVRLLVKHYGNDAPIVGSLSSLYAGLLNLDSSHFWTEAGKLKLLNPRNSSEIECSKLKLQIDDTPPTQCSVCKNWMWVNMHYGVKCVCPDPRNTMTGTNPGVEAPSEDTRVFTAKTSSFLLIDALQILINTPATLFRLLKLNGVEDTNALRERTLTVGLKEIMELLKSSLVSETPVADMVLHISSLVSETPVADMVLHISSDAPTFNEGKKFSASGEFEPDALPKSQINKNISSDSKRTKVKFFVQKSTNTVLFAQAPKDFIDILFSLLTIPLGRVQFLLGNNIYLGSITKLYRSISNLEIAEYMKSREAITRLLEPQIHPHYRSSQQMFSLNKQSPPYQQQMFFSLKKQSPPTINPYQQQMFSLNKQSPPTINPYQQYNFHGGEVSGRPCGLRSVQMTMIDQKDQDKFVKGPTTFMVTDELVVYTLSSSSIISTLNLMKIPISDVEEEELDIGIEEALSILKASLTTTCALSEGLRPFLKRSQPEQEK